MRPECTPPVFVVVVEIDNDRAAAAFKRGLEDLEALWPEIEAYCAPLDEAMRQQFDAEQVQYDKKVALYEARVKQQKEEWDEYQNRLTAWEQRGVFRGERPTPPAKELGNHYPMFRALYWKIDGFISGFQQKRDELRRLYRLASAARAPFKVKEDVALQMIGWEDGSSIAAIKLRISSS